MNSTNLHRVWSKLISAAVLLLAVHGVRAAESWPTNAATLGKLIVTPFATAPVPHPARAEGHKYQGQFFSPADHYADSTVAMFIPKHFQETGKVDFVVHFHGWNHTVAGTLGEYNLIGQLADSGRNAILIVPEGPHNALDSFGGKLEDPNGFARFMAEAVTTLRRSGALAQTNFEIGNIILSGHSGGYHVMAAIVDRGGLSEKIKEAWLFDALYGGTENFVAWQKKENGRLLNIYTDHGGTKDESEHLMAFLRTNGTSYFAAEDTNAVPENLRTNKIIFLHTALMHNDVVAKRGGFGQFLQTSCLEHQ